MTTETVIEVELDGRKRLPLARLINGKHRRYRATSYEDGTIVLSPVISFTPREIEMLSDTETIAELRKVIVEMNDHPENVTVRSADYYRKQLIDMGLDPDEDDES